jgi:hypothetical protein
MRDIPVFISDVTFYIMAILFSRWMDCHARGLSPVFSLYLRSPPFDRLFVLSDKNQERAGNIKTNNLCGQMEKEVYKGEN